MASQVEIANRAITKLGEARIISLGDDAKAAATITAIYSTVLDSELRDHWWGFSKARAQLPALSAAPAFGYARKFQLPADFLALRRVGDVVCRPRMALDGIYSIEGRELLTDLAAPLPIIYTRRVTDPNTFDALFVEVFACRLALESCEDITQSETKYQRVAAQYQQATRRAVRANALEVPPKQIADDTWLTSRR